MDRHTLSHAFCLAAAVIPLANVWHDCVLPGAAKRWHRQARRQAGRLAVAARHGDPTDALRRYEPALLRWLQRFA